MIRSRLILTLLFAGGCYDFSRFEKLPDGATPGDAGSGALLVGNDRIEDGVDRGAPGEAEAFRYNAQKSGVVTRLSIYVDATNEAIPIHLGLYSSSTTGDAPLLLLSSGVITAPKGDAWNTVAVPPVTIAAQTRYFIALLSPFSSPGTRRWRARFDIGRSVGHTTMALSDLPDAWSPGQTLSHTASLFAAE